MTIKVGDIVEIIQSIDSDLEVYRLGNRYVVTDVDNLNDRIIFNNDPRYYLNFSEVKVVGKNRVVKSGGNI